MDIRQLKQRILARSRAYGPALVVAVLAGSVGVVSLQQSSAATSAAASEAEGGTKSANAALVSGADATGASGSSSIRFGAAATGNGGDISDLPKITWEGGPNYWSQFAKANAAGWTDPNFFPITVFLGKPDPAHVSSLKDAGINTFNPMEHDPSVYPLTNITSQGMFAIPGGEWTKAEVGDNPKAVGWFISDECEMGMPTECTGGEAKALSQQTAWVNERKAYNDGRFVTANFGNGVIGTFWASTTMTNHVQLMDVASADKYTYTSPDVDSIIDGVHDAPAWPNGVPVNRAYSYGWQADQMRRYQNQSKLRPVWTFVESAKPFLTESGSKTITAEQMEGAVWSALIHEARGISYFQHNNGSGSCTATYSIVECPAVHNAVKAVNAGVKALAPVLNTQSYYNATRMADDYTFNYYTFNNGTDTMLKTYNGSAYIFAGLGMRCNTNTCSNGTVDAVGSKTFTLPAGVNGATVEVVNEARTIPVTNRTFTDTFAAEYSHHTYKIAL